jgi:serine phosphatase RsbU (regulator of sigma subunit)
MKFRPFSFLFFVLLPFALFSQNKKAVDSLMDVVKTSRDTIRVNALIELSNQLHLDNPDEAIRYATEARKLSSDLHFANGFYFGNMAIAVSLYGTGKYDSALVYFDIAKKTAEEQDDLAKLSSVNMNIGNVYGDIGQNRKCIQYYLLASDYAEKVNRPEKAAYIKVNIGTVYTALEQQDSALLYYEQAQKILEHLNPNHEKLPVVCNNIGATYLELGDTLKAEMNFKEAMRIAALHNNRRGLASSYEHLGVVLYFYHHLTDSAISIINNSISIYEDTHSKSGISEARMHLGEIYFREKRFDEAISCLETGVKVTEEIQNNYNLKVYYKILSGIYEAKQNPSLALSYYKKLMAVKDTIYNLSSSSLMSEMKTELANEKGKREIENLNAKSEKQTFIIYSAIAVGVLLLILAVLTFNRYLVKKRAGELLAVQKQEIQQQKSVIEEKNKDITDSIRYAQRIQDAILPSRDKIREIFPHSFVLLRPKDIVSGDFYWFEQTGDYKLFSVADCTGHGVPGAMLSMVGHNILNKAVHDNKIIMPDELLRNLSENISKMLRQNQNEKNIQDGMDIAICAYNEKEKIMYYSGAFNSLYKISNGKLEELKPDKIFIGNYDQNSEQKFTLHKIPANPGDTFYVFSDGFADQFGGPEGKKFKYKPFQQLIAGMKDENMESQEKKLEAAFDKWKNTLEQVDDVCVIGVRI